MVLRMSKLVEMLVPMISTKSLTLMTSSMTMKVLKTSRRSQKTTAQEPQMQKMLTRMLPTENKDVSEESLSEKSSR